MTKKAILLFVAASGLLFSCKEDHSATNPAKKTYQVNFNVSGITEQIIGSTGKKQQINSLQTNVATGITASIGVLYYFIYDSKGALVSQLTQDSTTANFGTISSNLTAGTYTIVFVGGKSALNMVLTDDLSTADIEGYPTGYVPWKDTFIDKFQLVVSTSSITQTVVLSRIVGELSINILDKLPANANSIALTVSNEFENYSFLDKAPYGTSAPYTATFTVPTSAIGTESFKRSLIMINTTLPFTATIVCYDANKKIIAQSIVTNVSLLVNTQTILTGYLFGADSGFNISLNQGWDPNTINFQF